MVLPSLVWNWRLSMSKACQFYSIQSLSYLSAAICTGQAVSLDLEHWLRSGGCLIELLLDLTFRLHIEQMVYMGLLVLFFIELWQVF